MENLKTDFLFVLKNLENKNDLKVKKKQQLET